MKDNSLNETASFVEIITRMWNIRNVKNVISGDQLNDDDRKPFRTTDDKRFNFLHNAGKSFEKCAHSSSGTRVLRFTSDTGKALKSTIDWLINLIKLLLRIGFEYMLPGEFQDDCIEGEFGISVDEIICSVT